MDNNKEINALDFQQIRINNVITLRKKVIEELQAELGDWVAIIPGPKPGTVLPQKQKSYAVESESEE